MHTNLPAEPESKKKGGPKHDQNY